jgi:hypothetical protein
MKNLTGQRFGKLLVVQFVGSSRQKRRIWKCACDCGGTIETASNNLISGDTKSCGCRGPTPRHGHKIGKKQSKVYTAWCNMKARCLKDTSPMYHAYGGRGITVCDRWKDSFENFLADVGEPSRSDLTLERLDPNGNYEPGNVAWASELVQRLNKQDTQAQFVDLKETLKELCNRSGVHFQKLFEAFLIGKPMRNILGDTTK